MTFRSWLANKIHPTGGHAYPSAKSVAEYYAKERRRREDAHYRHILGEDEQAWKPQAEDELRIMAALKSLKPEYDPAKVAAALAKIEQVASPPSDMRNHPRECVFQEPLFRRPGM